jgi:hypothetical protein
MFATAPLNETFRAPRAVERDTTYVRGFGSEYRERHSIRAAGARRIAGLCAARPEGRDARSRSTRVPDRPGAFSLF